MGMIKGHPATQPRDGQPRTIPTFNPATGELLAEVPVMGEEEVRAAVKRARAAQESWGALPVGERAKRLSVFKQMFLTHMDFIVDGIVKETGKPKQEALLHEVVGVVRIADYFLKNAEHILAPTTISLSLVKHRRSYLHYQPRGVVGIISPWNFPVMIPLVDAFMALIAGNAVVVKPSEVTPLTVLEIKKLFNQTGLNPDLFQIVTGDGTTGSELIKSGVDRITFTGSERVGRIIGRECGERLIPCALELGGKNPAIVLPDADLEITARAIIWGSFANSGQVCVAVGRVYVPESIHDELVRRCVELTKSLRQGDPSAQEVDVGSIIFYPQITNLEEQIKEAVRDGAIIETGGQPLNRPGQFFPPTILSNANQQMAASKEESFAPILPFIKVKNIEEAIYLANESRFGLMGYVFGKNREATLSVAEKMIVGTVMVNDVLVSFGFPETPWAGLRASGIGRVHSDDGLRDYCQTRHVNYGIINFPQLWWFPYSQKNYELIRSGAKALFASGLIGAVKEWFQRDKKRA